MKKIVASLGGFVVVLGLMVGLTSKPSLPNHPTLPTPNLTQPQLNSPAKPNITKAIPGYQDYTGIKNQLEEWKQQSPGLVETGSYGTSTKGTPLHFIRITNLLNSAPKKKVLITACIHGNEPHSCTTTMAFIGTMLSTYTTDQQVTELINTRDIYFIPVISPDSFPNSRHVDGVDPNRDFPDNSNKKSIKPLDDLQKWFLQIRFNAVISGHTHGRIYLIPHGNKMDLCANNTDYDRIIGQMQQLSRYDKKRACHMYNRPIYGSELDWYYKNGAFAIVCEYGTHQRIPSIAETQQEFDKTYKATLVFIKEAPLVQIASIVKLPQFNYTSINLHKGSRLLSPTTTINVIDVPRSIQFGVMSMTCSDNIAMHRFGEFNRFNFNFFSTPKVDFTITLSHPRHIMRLVYPLQK